MTTPRVTALIHKEAIPPDSKARTMLQVRVKTRDAVKTFCVAHDLTIAEFVDAVLLDALDRLEETDG